MHKDKVTWLGYWKENVADGTKYMWLDSGSSLKGENDRKKYELARNLKKKIGQIRRDYEKDFSDRDLKIQQRAVCLWIIDKLALRVGNEKGEDEADTVGCCSLRWEHVKLEEPSTVHFDFPGKDSIQYVKSVEVPEAVFKCMSKFVKGRTTGDALFSEVHPGVLNDYLTQLMPGLSAKVFRTYNASITLDDLLWKEESERLESVAEQQLFYNRANRDVAILCNHQKSVGKAHDAQMKKKELEIRLFREVNGADVAVQN